MWPDFYCQRAYILCFVFIRKEEQIKNDEQFARALQEKLQHESSPPEIISSDLLASRDNVDQGIDQGRGGQVSCFVQALLNCCNSLLTLITQQSLHSQIIEQFQMLVESNYAIAKSVFSD